MKTRVDSRAGEMRQVRDALFGDVDGIDPPSEVGDYGRICQFVFVLIYRYTSSVTTQ